jgi:single-stranded DNA-binding protein
MDSFELRAIGTLTRNPELIAKGEILYTRLCVIGSDYAGRDEGGSAREIVNTLWFVAFGPLGEAIAKNTRKGDQLFLEARVESRHWIDGEGRGHDEHIFVVTGFRLQQCNCVQVNRMERSR